MSIDRPKEREPGWWYQRAILKKFLYLSLAMAALSLLAVVFSYWQYNREAEQSWLEVEELMVQHFGANDLDEFYRKQEGWSDFRSTPVMVQLSNEGSISLDQFFSMEVWGENGEASFSHKKRDRNDSSTWFEEDLSEQESAQRVLDRVSEKYGELISQLEEAIDAPAEYRLQAFTEIGLDSYDQHVSNDGFELFAPYMFLCSRVHFSLLADNSDAAFADMQRLVKFWSYASRGGGDVSAIVYQHFHPMFTSLVCEGVEKHQWSKAHLLAFHSEISKFPPVVAHLKSCVAAEYFKYGPVLKLIDREGVRSVLEEDEYTHYVLALYGDLEVALLEELDVDDLYDYEEDLPLLLPKQKARAQAAQILKYLLTDYLDLLEMGDIREEEFETITDALLKDEEASRCLRREAYEWLLMLHTAQIVAKANELRSVGVELELYYLENGFYPEALSQIETTAESANRIKSGRWEYLKTEDSFELCIPDAECAELKKRFPSRFFTFFDQ